MKDIRNYSLLGHNTFGIDACCRRFVEYASVEEAQQIVASLSEADEPLLLLGGGSNLLLTQDYPGTVLHSAILGVRVVAEEGDRVFLECGSGADGYSSCASHSRPYHSDFMKASSTPLVNTPRIPPPSNTKPALSLKFITYYPFLFFYPFCIKM